MKCKLRTMSSVHLVLIAAVCLTATPMMGQYLKEFTLRELTHSGTDIVVANVVSTTSHWNADQTRIYTEVELEVVENVKGDLKEGDHFTIFYLGGSIDGVTTFAIEVPSFVTGRQSVLFLNRQPSSQYGDHFTVFGLNQGKFDIVTDRGVQSVTRPHIPNPVRLEPDGATLPLSATISMSLEEFLGHIRSYTR